MPVRLAWATDVHLDFLRDDRLAAFLDRVVALEPEAVLLSGDISTAGKLTRHLELVAAHVGRPVYFVLGNHDFYGGSIEGVRQAMRELTARSPHIVWLAEAGAVALTAHTALVGQDGWGDGRVGAFDRSRVLLNDWTAIADFAARDAMFDLGARLQLVRELADASARALAADLGRAMADEVVVVTHVPPFEGACWHEGAVSDPDWLPWFTCRAVGEVHEEEARRQPERRLRVLCGHTHSEGKYVVGENLEVWTGAAEYGAPKVRAVDVV